MKLTRHQEGDKESLEIRPSNTLPLVLSLFPAFIGLVFFAFTILAMTSPNFEFFFLGMLIVWCITLLPVLPLILFSIAYFKPFVLISKNGGQIKDFICNRPFKNREFNLKVSEIESVGTVLNFVSRPWAFMKNTGKKMLAPTGMPFPFIANPLFYTPYHTKNIMSRGLLSPMFDMWQFSEKEIREIAGFIGVPFKKKKDSFWKELI